ncbi:MAG: hypothetical protein AAF850_00675 [Pseudomonadota bacterium]
MENFFELMEARLLALDGVVEIVATLLTIISVYGTALYFYIAQGPLILRLAAVFVLTIAFTFLGVMGIGYLLILHQLEVCQGCFVPEIGSSMDLFGFITVRAHAMRDVVVVAGMSLTVFLYVVLVLMTFFTQWRKNA